MTAVVDSGDANRYSSNRDVVSFRQPFLKLVRFIAEHLGQRYKLLQHSDGNLGIHALPERSVLTANAFMTTLISHHVEEFPT